MSTSWQDLSVSVAGCTACPDLVATRRQVVVGVAPAGARLVCVGEAPGAQEDESGTPFVGRAGQVLDAALAAAGIDRAGIAVLNVLKCRPPANRTPLPAESARCRPWLDRQLEVIAPQLVLTLGGTATGAFLDGKFTLRDVRGRVHEVGGLRILPTYHPSGALRFGPNGAPMVALRADVALAAELLR